MANFETGFRTTLAAKLNAVDTTISVATAPTRTAGRMHIYRGSDNAWIKFTGVTGTTLTGVTFVSQTADPATTVTGQTFPAGTSIELVEMHDQVFDKQSPAVRVFATTADRDTALGSNGVATEPYSSVFVTATGLFYNYNTVTAQWESVDTGTSPVTALTGEIRMWGGSSAPSSWFLCDGTAVSRATYSDLFAIISTSYGVGDGSTTFNIPNFEGRSPIGRQSATSLSTATITIASPGVVTNNAHGLANGNKVYFTTSGALPTGIVASTEYFVVTATTNTFQVSATLGGTAINTTGSQSGTHTLFSANFNTIGETGGSVSHALSTSEMPAHTHTIGYQADSTGGAPNGNLASNDNANISTYNTGSTGSTQAHNNLQPYLIVNYIIKY